MRSLPDVHEITHSGLVMPLCLPYDVSLRISDPSRRSRDPYSSKLKLSK